MKIKVDSVKADASRGACPSSMRASVEILILLTVLFDIENGRPRNTLINRNIIRAVYYVVCENQT